MRISDWSSDVCSSDMVQKRCCYWPTPVADHRPLISARAYRSTKSSLLRERMRLPFTQASLDEVWQYSVADIGEIIIIVEEAERSEESRVEKESVSTCRTSG